jgi:membrane-bound lytic murein transglycosylase B
MKNYAELVQALVRVGFLSESNIKAAAAILAKHLETEIVEAEDTREFATKDLTYQQRVIDDAEDLAEEDLSMGDISDRFVQAEIIESAHSLADKDEQMIKHADEELTAAFKNAADALLITGLIDAPNLKTTAAILAEAWQEGQES